MMTLRQTYDVCKRGYRYDIERDRFISDKEDTYEYLKMYGSVGTRFAIALKEHLPQFRESVRKFLLKNKK